jgi:hypothetical protein
MAAPKKVFITCAATDIDAARKLADELSDLGISALSAPDDFAPGANWRLEVGKALGEADAVLVLVSPASMKSEFVMKDVEYALSTPRLKRRLIPIKVKATNEFPWVFEKLQFLDATKRITGVGKRVAKALEGPAGTSRG